MADIGTITTTLTANIAGYVTPMRQAAVVQQQFAQTSEAAARKVAMVNDMVLRAERGSRRFTNALGMLSMSAIGLHGPLATVVSTLAMIGLGSATATAVIGGLGLIALAYQKLTASARDAAAAAKAAADEYMKAFGGEMQALKELAAAQDDARAALADYNALVTDPKVIAFTKQWGIPQEVTNAWNRWVAALQRAALAAKDLEKFRPAATIPTPEEPAAARPGRLAPSWMAVWKDADAKRRQLVESEKEAMRKWWYFIDDGARAAAERAAEALAAQREAMVQVGEAWAENISRGLVRGILSGKVFDAFKNVFATLLEQVIVRAILRALKGAAGGGGFFATLGSILGFQTGGVVPGPQGQPQLAVVHGGETVTPAGGSTLTINVPAFTGMAMVSHPDVQNWFRAVAREAGRQGFRMAVV